MAFPDRQGDFIGANSRTCDSRRAVSLFSAEQGTFFARTGNGTGLCRDDFVRIATTRSGCFWGALTVVVLAVVANPLPARVDSSPCSDERPDLLGPNERDGTCQELGEGEAGRLMTHQDRTLQVWCKEGQTHQAPRIG